jgi:predicted dehydrogenase
LQASGDEETAKAANRELVELIDWCRYVVDQEPVSVTGSGHLNGQSADYRSLTLHFGADDTRQQVTAQISCGSYIPAAWHEAANFRPPEAMQICCQRGVAFVDLPSTLVWFDDAGRHMESLETESSVGEQLLTHFHRAVTSLVRNLGDMEDAYRAVEVLLAARESDRQGRRILM